MLIDAEATRKLKLHAMAKRVHVYSIRVVANTVKIIIKATYNTQMCTRFKLSLRPIKMCGSTNHFKK